MNRLIVIWFFFSSRRRHTRLTCDWSSDVCSSDLAAGFIVPFFFIYYPALLFQGTWTEVGLAVLTGGVGVIALAAALEGYFIRRATWLERGIFMVAALLLIDPSFVTDLVGVALLGTALMMQRLRPAAVPVDPRYL